MPQSGPPRVLLRKPFFFFSFLIFSLLFQILTLPQRPILRFLLLPLLSLSLPLRALLVTRLTIMSLLLGQWVLLVLDSIGSMQRACFVPGRLFASELFFARKRHFDKYARDSILSDFRNLFLVLFGTIGYSPL
ncbi:hypothetical protein BJY04DRAFT_196007 [Aspergillus karnatakaensis]|uniref:uncharacterized protein n=1 Tax=Aspergillus karnatakaensis TaxID=1810916 RepID=UPI003CCCBF70